MAQDRAGEAIEKLYERLKSPDNKWCVWPVNSRSMEYAYGLVWGVTLYSLDSDGAKKEMAPIELVVQAAARDLGLMPLMNGPHLAAGGVAVVYCGFRSELLIAMEENEKKKREGGDKVALLSEKALDDLRYAGLVFAAAG